MTNYNEILEFVRNRRSRWTFTRNDLEILLHMMSIGVSDRMNLGLSASTLAEAARDVVPEPPS